MGIGQTLYEVGNGIETRIETGGITEQELIHTIEEIQEIQETLGTIIAETLEIETLVNEVAQHQEPILNSFVKTLSEETSNNEGPGA